MGGVLKKNNKGEKHQKEEKISSDIQKIKKQNINDDSNECRTKTMTTFSENSNKSNKIIQFITAIGGGGLIFPLLQSFMNKIAKSIYQAICASFYKIPGDYFSTDMIDGLMKVIVAVLLVLFLFGYKKLLNKVHEADKVLYKILYAVIDVAMALSYGYVILSGILTIVNYIEVKKGVVSGIILGFLNRHVYLFLIFVIVLSVLTVLIFNNFSLINKINNRIVKGMVFILGIIGFVTTIYVFAASIFIANSNDVRNKTDYEIITYKNVEYAVLNKDDEKYLIVEFYEKDNEIVLFTNTYKNVNGEGLDIRYEKWEAIPEINSEDSKKDYFD